MSKLYLITNDSEREANRAYIRFIINFWPSIKQNRDEINWVALKDDETVLIFCSGDSIERLKSAYPDALLVDSERFERRYSPHYG